MALDNKTVSFIGSGVMAEAMIKGLLTQKLRSEFHTAAEIATP